MHPSSHTIMSSSLSVADPLLIGRVRSVMERYNLNQIDVMRESGVSNSVLCLWLQQKYRGDNNKINERMMCWLSNVDTHASTVSPPVFHREDAAADDTTGDGGGGGALIPIKIDISVGAQRFEDSFLWSANENARALHVFVRRLVADCALPTTFIAPTIARCQEQIDEFKSEERRRRSDRDDGAVIRIDLDLSYCGARLVDRFLWALQRGDGEVEEFSRVLCSDLGLGGDWCALIAWTMRRQIYEARAAINDDADSSERTPYEWPNDASVLFRTPSECTAWSPQLSLRYPTELANFEAPMRATPFTREKTLLSETTDYLTAKSARATAAPVIASGVSLSAQTFTARPHTQNVKPLTPAPMMPMTIPMAVAVTQRNQ